MKGELTISNTKKFEEITLDHFRQLAKKAGLPVYLVLHTVKEMIDTVLSAWEIHRLHYELPREIIDRINRHIRRLSLFKSI